MKKIISLVMIVLSLQAYSETEVVRSAYLQLLGFRYDGCQSNKGKWEYFPDVNDPRPAGQGKCFAVTCTVASKKDLVDKCLNLSEALDFSKNVRPSSQHKTVNNQDMADECHFDDHAHQFISCPNGDRYQRMQKSLMNAPRETLKKADPYGPNTEVQQNFGLGM